MAAFAVLFDIDGLMLDTDRMARAAWTRALAENGYVLDESSYLRFIGRTLPDTQAVLYDLFGPDLPYEQIFELRQAYYDADIEQNGILVKPGTRELLDFLEAHQVLKAVASSTPCWFATRKLAAAGLEQRFQVIVCGDMAARGKPFPDLFLEAARRIDYPSRKCMVLEDSEAGILAAHSAGMLPVMVPDLRLPSPEVRALTYRVFSTLFEVIPLIDGFLRDGFPGGA